MKIDYTIKGTKLPIIPEGTEYRCSNWDYDVKSSLFQHSKIDFISYGWTSYKGYTYIYCENKNYKGVAYFMVKLSDIEKLTKTQESMRTIKYSDAQRIVDIACSEWKELLFNSWGKDIVLKKDINIPLENYQNMRKACTAEQHKLFDDIFGEDKPNFKIGDWIMYDSLFKAGAYQIKSFRNNDVALDQNGDARELSCGKYRLATEEEIKAANVFPDGTPCLVRDNLGDNWKFYYANGKGEFYAYGRKSGINSIPWKYSMKLDMDNLPVNE